MLTIFKSINNGTQVAEWQQAFSQKYQGVDFGNNWGWWSSIEKWINSKVLPLNDTLVQRQKGINTNDYQKNCLLLQLRMQIILLCFKKF
jgi:hypothetical protein